MTPGGPFVYCACLSRKARARSADSIAWRVSNAPGTVQHRTQIEGDMKRKKGEDGGEFDVFGEDETNEYGEAAIEGEETELYDDDLEEEFDDEDSDFDEDFDEDESFDEEEEDFDDLVDNDE